MLIDYAAIGIFLIGSIFFVSGAYIASWILRASKKSVLKESTYECGMSPIHPAWIQFRTAYYTFIIIFLVFEVEVVFIFPWGVILKELGVIGLIEGIVFIFILLVGLIYAYLRGGLIWLRK